MPINIPKALPAFEVLGKEGVMVMDEDVAARQDIRPIEIGLLNLMPLKISTEIQFARLIGATPLQINLTLIRMTEHRSLNTPPDHIEAFYETFESVSGRKFDGLIVTGAPVEHLAFDEVDYWSELKEVFDWSQSHVHSTLGVCWGGMAMLYYWHGVTKHILDRKLFGLFHQRNRWPSSPFLRGFSDECFIPVSRWTEMSEDEIESTGKLRTLLGSAVSGPCLVQDLERQALYIFDHFEYDTDTLHAEYRRDVAKNVPIEIPANFFPDNNPKNPPSNRWRSHGHLLYGNWINEIYQSTPFDLDLIGG